MLVISKEMLTRFLRLWLWVPAFILPFFLFCMVLLKESASFEFAQKLILDCLLYLLPALAVITVLTSVDRSKWTLLLTRPIRLHTLLIGVWVGGILPYLLCYLALIFIVMGVGSFYKTGEGIHEEATAVEYHLNVRFWRGVPANPLPPPEMDSLKKLEWLKMNSPWTFDLRGIGEIVPSPSNGDKIEGRFLAEVGRAIVESHGHDGDHALLYKARDIPVVVKFLGEDGKECCPAKHLSLLDQKLVPFDIPPEAVLDNDRLLIMVEKDNSQQHHQHENHHERQGIHESHEDNLVFWFDRVLKRGFTSDAEYKFKPSLTENYTPASGLLVVSRRRSVNENFFRIGILAMGLLPMVVGMATFTVVLFGPAVAFAFNLTIFLCGLSMSFLREVIESLSIVSSSMLLGDPTKSQILKKPTWFDSALESYLKFWITVLPDFQIFQGSDFLIKKEMANWLAIGESYVVSISYATSFLLLAFLFIWRREIKE